MASSQVDMEEEHGPDETNFPPLPPLQPSLPPEDSAAARPLVVALQGSLEHGQRLIVSPPAGIDVSTMDIPVAQEKASKVGVHTLNCYDGNDVKVIPESGPGEC